MAVGEPVALMRVRRRSVLLRRQASMSCSPGEAPFVGLVVSWVEEEGRRKGKGLYLDFFLLVCCCHGFRGGGGESGQFVIRVDGGGLMGEVERWIMVWLVGVRTDGWMV